MKIDWMAIARRGPGFVRAGPVFRFIFVEESGHESGSSRLQEKKGPREGGREGGKFSLKYKGNISTPLDGEFA